MWGLQEPDGKTGTARLPQAGKWPDRARRFLFKMVGPGRMVTPGTGPILKTTRRFQVAPFLPQAKRRGRKGSLFVCWTNRG
jgi:hypothetical protein